MQPTSESIVTPLISKSTGVASYAGGGLSVLFALTLTDVGIIIGIFTAIVTFIANMIYQWRRDRREQVAHELRLKRLLKKEEATPE